MIKKIIIFSVLIVVILGQNKENSFFFLAKDVGIRLKDSTSDGSLFHKNICLLTDEDWLKLKQDSIQYLVDTRMVNYQTGTFNLTHLDEIATPQQRDNFFASQCEESYNGEEDMDSKIAVIVKRTLLRAGNCGNLPDKAEACKEVLPSIGNDESGVDSTDCKHDDDNDYDDDDDYDDDEGDDDDDSDDEYDGYKKKRSRGNVKSKKRSHQKNSRSKKSHAKKFQGKKSRAGKSHHKKSHVDKSRDKKSNADKSHDKKSHANKLHAKKTRSKNTQEEKSKY